MVVQRGAPVHAVEVGGATRLVHSEVFRGVLVGLLRTTIDRVEG